MTPSPDDAFDPDLHRVSMAEYAALFGKKTAAAKRPPRHKRGERFLWGPVPLAWLGAAGQLPGRALHVATVLWWLLGVQKHRSDTVKWMPSIGRMFGLDYMAAHRGLQTLERAGMVRVSRHRGRSPVVTILPLKVKPDAKETEA